MGRGGGDEMECLGMRRQVEAGERMEDTMSIGGREAQTPVRRLLLTWKSQLSVAH